MAGYGFNIGLDGRNVQPMTEEAAEEIADGLRIIYGRAREHMLDAVSRRLARGVKTYGWAERKAGEIMAAHNEIEQIYSGARTEREELIGDLMERSALAGNQQFYRDTQAILGDVAHISPNSQKTAYILADLQNSLNAAERRILRQFDDAYANTIGSAASLLATGVLNYRQAIGQALEGFADQGIDCFIDRGGHHWTLEAYASMAVITAIERATLSGYTDTMQSYGMDLAFIDDSPGACPVCAAWAGVIISLSGSNPNYPSLSEAEAAGVFHPNCVHGITAYYEGISHAPEGGFRDEPREKEPPNEEYTTRSRMRYCERLARKYSDRARVAQTPQAKSRALDLARQWREAAKEQREKLFQ